MLDLHRVLVGDSARTLAYREAVRTVVSPGDVVVDLGSGIGVLAFFACAAGARRVFAIEEDHVADTAFLLARHLGYADRLEVFHDHSTRITLPERANVLVTETLGILGVDEGLLGNVIDARRRLLRPDATIVPRRVALSLVPVECPAQHREYVAGWSERRYDLDLSLLHSLASNGIYRVQLDPPSFLCAPAQAIEVDLATVIDPAVSAAAAFVIERDGLLHGFAVWFTATLAPGLTLTSGPPEATHWGQAFLPLEQPVAVARGARIAVALESLDGSAWRWRGTAANVAFDQTTRLGAAPCRARRRRSWREHPLAHAVARRLRRWTTAPLR